MGISLFEEDVMASKPTPKTASSTSKRPTPKGKAPLPQKPVAKTATKTVDLGKLFGTVAKTMVQNQASLNEADTYNHDHGDNMVQTFEVITQAMKEKADASPADQLAYASQLLRAKSQSGSAQLYAEGLADAAKQFTGSKAITTDTAMTLIQTLLGAQGSVPAATTQTQAGGSSDMLGSLLGGLLGGQETPAAGTQSTGQGQIDIGSLLNAGMAFAQTKQSGGSNLDAIMNAVVSSSKMGDSAHRTQSGALVANTLMQVVSQLAAK
jgi:hypothetical protein